MIIKLLKPRFRNKILFLDFDWTLVKPKTGHTFPKDIDDWQWLRANVPLIITDYYKHGYAIYIVTNQSKLWKIDQVKKVCESLQIPITICIAFGKENYKPSLTIYHEAIDEIHRNKINLKKSFMCGDALGRATDHSDCDKKFAEAIGISIKSPEELFPFNSNEQKLLIPKIKAASQQEVIIMVGYPGSGKSTLIDEIFTPAGYFIAHGDEYKTSAKMIKAAEEPCKDGKSIVFDATNPSRKKRAEYVSFAKKYNLPVRCVEMTTSLEESLARNLNREKPIPRIAYNLYKKNFEEPTEDEDFTVIKI